MAPRDMQASDWTLTVHLAGGAPVAAAARAAGMSERTAYRRLQAPDFKASVDAARRAAVGKAVDLLAARLTAAVATLSGLLRADSEQVRLGAAKAVLEYSARFRELLELEARVTELEAAQTGLPGQTVAPLALNGAARTGHPGAPGSPYAPD